jgi:hypothetical protein
MNFLLYVAVIFRVINDAKKVSLSILKFFFMYLFTDLKKSFKMILFSLFNCKDYDLFKFHFDFSINLETILPNSFIFKSISLIKAE